MNGSGASRFTPQGTVTTAKAATLAARIHSLTHGGDGTMLYIAQEGALVFLPDFGETSNGYIDRCRQLMAIPTPEQWYRDAMWYLEQNGLRKALVFQPSDQTATRLQLAQAIALTAGELEPINQVSPAPDLYDDQWDLVKPLYEAGILNGVDGYGTFRPQGALSRAEAAAMAARVLRPDLRLTGGRHPGPPRRAGGAGAAGNSPPPRRRGHPGGRGHRPHLHRGRPGAGLDGDAGVRPVRV